MLIEFGKHWGQDDNRWAYCGADWNFKTMAAFMEYYGIASAKPIGKEEYYAESFEPFLTLLTCVSYEGNATKNLDEILKGYSLDGVDLSEVSNDELLRFYNNSIKGREWYQTDKFGKVLFELLKRNLVTINTKK